MIDIKWWLKYGLKDFFKYTLPDWFLKLTTPWESAGHCDVDSGLIWIGDPCYIMANTKRAGKREGEVYIPYKYEDLDEINFGDWPGKEHERNLPLNVKHKIGHVGRGVVTDNRWGDGSYEVSVKKDKRGCVMSMKIEF